MRPYLMLIITAITMAFLSGYALLFVQGRHTASAEDVATIARLKYDFQKDVSPVAIVNFNSIYYSKDQIKLIDPFYIMPHGNISDEDRYSTDRDCFKDWQKFSNRPGVEKIWLWEQFRCGRVRSLPESFFTTAPFIHPSGKSYAYLAFKFSEGLRRSKKWVLQNLSLFHVTELAEIRETVGRLDGIYDLFAGLDSDVFEQIVSGKGSILTQRYLIARIRYTGRAPILEYRFYWRDDLDRFIGESPFTLTTFKKGATCFFKDGELCWDYNAKHIFQLANRGTLMILSGLIIICILVVRLLIQKIRQQRLEEQRKRVALQVLTHEFRTPVASLLLLVESGNRVFSQMGEDAQEIFLRMSSEIFRLQRLTEKSRSYLHISQTGRIFELKPEQIDSLGEVIRDIVINYEDQDVAFEECEQKVVCRIDSYWFQMIVKNFIENALRHGRPPVIVRLIKEGEQLVLEVEDQGEPPEQELSVLTEEFVKGNSSQGSGLGLNIVKNIGEEMGARLELKTYPTRFRFVFKSGLNGEDRGQNFTS